MSAQPAANLDPEQLGQSQQRTHGLFIYVLVIVSGFLLLVVLDGAFSHLIATLDKQIDNERQRLRIGEVVLHDLKVLEANIYKMAITYNSRGQRLIREDITERLSQLEMALDVLEHGGTLERETRINIESQDNMRQRITYQKDPSEVFVLEVIDLRPKLQRIREKTAELGEMMAENDTSSIHTADNTQHAHAIKSYLLAVPPEFIRMNENAARLLFISKQKTEELEQKIQQRTWLYQLIEGVFSALVIVVFSLFSYKFNRKLQFANKHLQDSSLALLSAKQAAETANRAKSAFLANMSHELRTPLNAVLGFAQVLQHDTSLNTEQKQQVDTIKRSGDYLLTLINDVLDLAKIEAGRLDLIPSSCEIDSFFRELAHLFQSRAKDKNIDFRYEPTDTLPYYVEVDEKRLRQICMNLLSNAVKFTEKGEVRLEVDYRRTEPVLKNCPLCGELTIWVSDTGIGIPMEEQASVFKPFQQAGENEYKQQGTGLGLPITQNLVEQMGGQIKLESDIEQGSCFIVQIPVPELEAANPMNPKTALTMATGYQRTDGIQTPLRILEADDVPLNRALVRGLLEPLGFEVTEVESGAEAVAITEQQTFDLIIMDLVMPEMDGLTATRQILARSSEVNRYIVALTARAFDENRIECLEAGCCEHLSKPLETERLLQVLQTFLPLEWVYHNQQVTTATDISILDDSSYSIPMETLDALEDALIRGAVDEIETLLEPIKSQDNTLGATLQQWLEQYEYQKMLDWIEANKSVSPVTALSIETLNTLENALIRGAVDEVETLLESVKTQNTKLATTLKQWLEQYEYQKMLDWIETMKQ